MNFYQCMRVMKITMILLTCVLVQVSAASYAQLVSINRQNTTIHTILEEIRKQTKYDFFYDTNLFNKEKQVSIYVKDASIEEVLNTCLKGKPYQYVIKKNMVVITATDKPTKTPIANQLPQQQLGRIAGKVIDERGEPLPGAGIKVLQTDKLLQSNADGSYNLSIAEGIYTLEVSYISFQTKRVTDVIVKAGQLTALDIVLNAATNKLSQVVVTGTFKNESINALYVRQKNDAAISNGISREQMAALPDKNIGETLKRISGVSTTDNRRVVVRGIAERYNVAMMDGATLPSTDVQTRDFEFDIIPSNLVDNVIVSKTATPDMGFGFGGGLVQVNTMAIPSQDFISFSIGSKYINGSTGKDFLGYGRGKSDYLGFDDGKRDHFPKDLLYITSGNYNPTNPSGTIPAPGNEKVTPEMITAQNKKIGGLERLGTRIYQTAPGQNYQFSLGRSYGLKNSRFGFVGSLSYRNEQAIDDIASFERGAFNKLNNNTYDPITNEELKKTAATQYNFTTSLGALVNLGWSTKNHKVTLRNFYSRAFANQFFRISGWGEDLGFGDNPAVREYDRPKFIDLLQNKISGEHTVGKLRLDWGVARNRVNNHEQDAVDANLSHTTSLNGTSYNYIPGGTAGGTTNPGPLSRSSYKYVETNWMADAALSYKFNIRKSVQTFKTGYQYMDKKGGFDWSVLPIGTASSFDNGYKPVQQWDIDFKDPLHDIYYFPAQFNNNSYVGKNNNQALYGMMDNHVGSWLRLVWGMRAEYYKYEKVLDGASDKVSQADLDNADKVRYVDPETGNLVHRTYDASAEEKKWLYMPSANLTLTPFANFNVRASYAKSAVRPALIENSSFSRFNYLYGRIQRNTGVISTIISHYDLRMEWYPSAGEVLSAGYFKKRFNNPVEMYLDITNTSGAIDLLTANSDYANVHGWELDLRKNLGFINKGWKFLANMYFSGNLTLQNSEVQASAFRYTSMGASDDVDGKSYQYRSKTYLREKRPLYGQVPVLYNAALQYAGERLSANVAFNHSGYKVFTVGMLPQYSEMERPRNQLDAQLGFKFLKSKKLETRLNMSNLLNSPYRFFINGKETYKIKPGGDNMTMKEWSDVYEWKYGFSDKYEEGYFETSEDGIVRRIGDTNSLVRKIGTSFSLSLTYNL
ncbi:TonB-dependent receptor [Pedobacter polaris]|uniref:TonB-dependent receptor n=1 Tax=Pedobacter polaris TaxID=2571273 RepID=A0A4U1CJD1_9SPHI|nr:TonB-dependent receptor [Pedobacter polaris]TKC06654.1 TonB-dependent receptor [Pedobacter polaris]